MKNLVIVIGLMFIPGALNADTVCSYETTGESTVQTCIEETTAVRDFNFEEIKSFFQLTTSNTQDQWAKQIEALKAAESFLIVNPSTAKADYIINILSSLETNIQAWKTRIEATKP